MMDENQQAQDLRRRLDRELAAVQADAQARQRLLSEVANRARRGSAPAARRDWRHLGPSVALPLAAAAVLVGVVAVPSYLRSDSGGSPAPGAAPSSSPATSRPTPTQTPTATPSAVPVSPRPVATPTPTQTPPSARAAGPEGLEFTTSPEAPTRGERVTLAVRDSDRQHGSMTVDWGDGTRLVSVPGVCGRTVPVPSITHSYARSGRFQITLVIERCTGSRSTTARVPLTVAPAPTGVGATPGATPGATAVAGAK